MHKLRYLRVTWLKPNTITVAYYQMAAFCVTQTEYSSHRKPVFTLASIFFCGGMLPPAQSPMSICHTWPALPQNPNLCETLSYFRGTALSAVYYTNVKGYRNGRITEQVRTTFSRHGRASWCLQLILPTTGSGYSKIPRIDKRSGRCSSLSCCKNSIN